MNTTKVCCVIRHHHVSRRSLSPFSCKEDVGGCPVCWVLGWEAECSSFKAEHRKKHCQVTLEQGTKPTTAQIGSCDELVNHPGVDLPLATLTFPMTPKRKKQLRRQTFLHCHEGLCAPGLIYQLEAKWTLSQNALGTIFALWQGKLSSWKTPEPKHHNVSASWPSTHNASSCHVFLIQAHTHMVTHWIEVKMWLMKDDICNADSVMPIVGAFSGRQGSTWMLHQT